MHDATCVIFQVEFCMDHLLNPRDCKRTFFHEECGPKLYYATPPPPGSDPSPRYAVHPPDPPSEEEHRLAAPADKDKLTPLTDKDKLTPQTADDKQTAKDSDTKPYTKQGFDVDFDYDPKKFNVNFDYDAKKFDVYKPVKDKPTPDQFFNENDDYDDESEIFSD